MKNILSVFVLTMFLAGCGKTSPELKRFYSLGDVIEETYRAGKLAEVKTLCAEYLELAEKYKKNWNSGNAVHKGNNYLGLVALDEDRIEDAKQYLLKAGDTPGSPQLDSFGPNMALAKALLEKGEKQTVLEYMEKVGDFWDMDNGLLATWKKDVKADRIPDFGANLVY